MSRRLGLSIVNILGLLALVGAAGFIVHAPTRDHASASMIRSTHQSCRALPNYILDVLDRPAARDGYLVVCFGDPLARGPIMDFRIER